MIDKPYDELPDRELAQLILKGDSEAFAAVFRRYSRDLYRHAAYYLKDSDAADDIVQDVFVKLWTMSEALCISSSLQSYLYAMTRNLVLNNIRSRTRELARNFTMVQEECFDAEEEFWEKLGQQKREQMLDGAVETLSAQQKMVVMMRRAGYGNKDIASFTGLSVNTIKSHFREAMGKMRKIMTKDVLTAVAIMIVPAFSRIFGLWK